MDSDDFSVLVARYYEPLYKFALSLTRVEADACDLTQHTFYIWATKGHQLRDPSKAKTWLFTTMHRAFLETRRKQVRYPHHELEEVASELPMLSPRVVERLDAAHALSALARLDEHYRAAVALCYMQHCSYKEMAAILEVPIGTVKSRIARGLAQLRQILSLDASPAVSSGEEAV